MKTLLILLLLTACGQTKQEAKPCGQKEASAVSMDSAETAEVVQSEPLIASYENSDPFILLVSDYPSWYRDVIRFADGQILLEDFKDPLLHGYSALYWDTNSHIYYGAYIEFSTNETANIGYLLDPKKQHENVFHDSQQEIFLLSILPPITNTELSSMANTRLLYAGIIVGYSEDKISRLYINKADDKQYIKILYPIPNMYWDEQQSKYINIDSPLYPALIKDDFYNYPTVIYTNSDRSAFGIYAESGFTPIDFPEAKKFVENN